jgi:hypothetical protein
MSEAAGSRDSFCEEQMRTRHAVVLSELSSRRDAVRVGERSKVESANIFARLLELPSRNAYALDPREAAVRDPRTGQAVALPDAPLMLGDFILELSTDADDRRAVFRGIQPRVESQGYELPPDEGQRFIFFSIK